MIDWYKKVVFENYANFSGRARRSEYWYFTLCNFLIIMVLLSPMIFSLIITQDNSEPPFLFYVSLVLIIIYQLAILIPTLAVSVRRLHDSGKSGWYYLVNFIPYVGGIIFLVLACIDSEDYANKWGENPKATPDEINQIGGAQF